MHCCLLAALPGCIPIAAAADAVLMEAAMQCGAAAANAAWVMLVAVEVVVLLLQKAVRVLGAGRGLPKRKIAVGMVSQWVEEGELGNNPWWLLLVAFVLVTNLWAWIGLSLQGQHQGKAIYVQSGV
jgi:hypothetical protein